VSLLHISFPFLQDVVRVENLKETLLVTINVIQVSRCHFSQEFGQGFPASRTSFHLISITDTYSRLLVVFTLRR